jgi:ubiquinone biosynthesis protein COQ9
MLAYTEQIKWIVSEMQKEFPNSGWTEKLVYRSLIRVRKAGYLETTERRSKNKLVVPEFAAEEDMAELEPLDVGPDGKVRDFLGKLDTNAE